MKTEEENQSQSIADIAGKKVLVLGGTGAMGVYLVPELASRGCLVSVVSLDDAVSDDLTITYIKGNAKDDEYLKVLLEEKFDIIVDFMLYTTEEFRNRYDLFLQNTAHYIFLSSYRVYNNDSPLTENSRRLLDTSEDKDFLATEDYSLYKARQEDILQDSKYDNWTIVRPAITYSKFRYQLVTLEAPVLIARALKGLPVVLPEEAMSVQATMSWAGDVAKMFSHLLLKEAAYRECFTLSTAEHHTWGEIAEYYNEILDAEYILVDTEEYIKVRGDCDRVRYQLYYDRLFDRVVDNSKLLRVTGLKQEDFIPLREGLKKELTALPKDPVWPDEGGIRERMDSYAKHLST